MNKTKTVIKNIVHIGIKTVMILNTTRAKVNYCSSCPILEISILSSAIMNEANEICVYYLKLNFCVSHVEN